MAKANSEPVNPITQIQQPELFIGVVAPLGSDLSLVCNTLSEELKQVGYSSKLIRLSALIRSIEKYSGLPDHPEDERIEKFMDAGTELREKLGRGDALSFLAVRAVQEFRNQERGEGGTPIDGQAYIFRSIKHPDEAQALRDIYGRQFILISAYEPRDRRVDTLAKIIADSRGSGDQTKHRGRAEELVKKDEEEEGKSLGQDVTDAFPLADFFIHVSERSTVRDEVRRIIEILFSYPYHTPNQDEMGMYFAHAAGLRSADLSRQVGATGESH